MPLVEYGPEALGSVTLEVGHCHFSRQDERHRPGEEAERDQAAADELAALCERSPTRRAPPLGGLGADGGLTRAPSRLCTRSAMGPSR